MKNLKNIVLLILLLTFFNAAKDAAAQTGRKKTSRKAKKSQTTKVKVMTTAKDIKILASGSYSKVETPFVLVARDAETYALIRGLVEDLPPSSTVDFNQTAVVAAFAGEKNTGGYSVAIRSNDERVTIELIKPQKGDMTTQVITTPFQVAAIPLDDSQNLPLEIPMEWTNRIKSYRITKGEFESSGGIAGRIKKFGATGTIGVISHNDLVTYIFDLFGTKTESARKLSSVASGVLKEGIVEITKMEAGNLAEMPRPPLKALGKVESSKISFTFESFPPTVADGFTTRGNVEAVRNK
ncbi:MAG: protease complex subunit PrcB family protein [Pyrinomonadaceae bacterium]